MGMCYYAEITFRVWKGREDGLRRTMTEFLQTHNFSKADAARLEGMDFEDFVNESMRLLFPYSCRQDDGKKHFFFTAEFNASYGWESLMCEAFEIMAPFLRDGSSLGIWPDSGHYWLRTRDGKVA